MLKNALKRIPPIKTVSEYLHWCKHYRKLFVNYPPGHYYSPLPDIKWVNANQHMFYAREPKRDGIDLRTESQQALFTELAHYFAEYNFPIHASEGFRYYSSNTMFGKGSALVLFGILRRFQPKRIIEIGSGHTSALMLDTNDRFLDGQIKFSFIEPYAERLHSLLTQNDKTSATILEKRAQDVPVSFFDQLEVNDLLFIDSSHVSKIGSDVNYIFFEILPALKPGVITHFHDIYWPFEYPLKWINEARAWNEAYLLRAFLQYNNQFEIILFNNYLGTCWAQHYNRLTHSAGSGSSIWIRKK